jgi:hypothetical protein
MRRKWTGQNVDLNSLSDGVEDFFKSMQFVTKKSESAGERKILLQPTFSTVKLEEPINVRITGDPNDFVIELRASELTTRSVRMGMLTKSLGGGYYLLRSLKLQEELEKLEKEFWIFVEDKVAQLARSA